MKKEVNKRKWWFRLLKKIMLIKYKRPTFMFLDDGKPFIDGSIILSNHEGTDAPMSLEIFCHSRIRMWGAWEMNSGLVQMYKYQSKVYYHEKKHWNLFAARAFCLIASPLTNLFYKGLNLISTYKDGRFIKTIKESLRALDNDESIVIYPEDSTNGYLPELEGFYAGFVALADAAKRKGKDVPIYVTYFKKSERVYVVDKPIYYSELLAQYKTKEEIADRLRLRCNELGKMSFTDEEKAMANERYYGQVKYEMVEEDQKASELSAEKK